MWGPCQLPSVQRQLEMLKMNQPKKKAITDLMVRHSEKSGWYQ